MLFDPGPISVTLDLDIGGSLLGVLTHKIFRSGPLRNVLLLNGLVGGLGSVPPAAEAAMSPPSAPSAQTAPIDPDRRTDLPAFAGMDATLMNQWRATLADSCLQPGERPDSAQEVRLAEIYDGLRSSEVGNAIVEAITPGDVTLCDDTTNILKDRFEAYYVYPFKAAILDLDNARFDTNTLVDLAGHEKRHAMQAHHLDLAPYLMEKPQAALALTYIIEADAMAHQLAVSWEREQAGHVGAWNPDRFGEGGAYQLMAQAFEGVMQAAPDQARDRPATMRQAMAAAFDQWLEHDVMREAYARDTKAAYQSSQQYFTGLNDGDTSWKRDFMRPERLVAMTGHMAGDRSGQPYLDAAKMRAAMDRAAIDYQVYGWAATFDKPAPEPDAGPIIHVGPRPMNVSQPTPGTRP